MLNRFARALKLFGLGLSLSLLAGCGQTVTHAKAAKIHTITITDDTGRTVILTHKATRIVTIAPSNTEIALDLGLKNEIVGTDTMTFEYAPPPWASELKGLHNIGSSFPSINIKQIVATKPNLVLAIPGIKGLSALQHFHIPVIILSPQNINGVYHDIQIVGIATGRTQQAKTLISQLKTELTTLQHLVRKNTHHTPTVFLDLGQLYSAGPNSYLNNLITMAGGKNIADQFAHTAYPVLTPKQIVKANPEDIIYDPTDATAHVIATLPGFSHVRAVKDNHILAMPEPSYIDEPSPAIAMGLAELIHLLHPHVTLPHDLLKDF
ncbi:ABC transporter substrate-binding protein [Sulfobacillus thermosulfidooxidans]|uniref:ABC transporter substrate-binding protein n=1 Tax=Sulfobacillus thermosulfidooxidans TaxID=28034 RepID=UPI0002EAB249|nr:ABC transporter substrate-binding protein [Sulfobacillus thermosulfidooxidans]